MTIRSLAIRIVFPIKIKFDVRMELRRISHLGLCLAFSQPPHRKPPSGGRTEGEVLAPTNAVPSPERLSSTENVVILLCSLIRFRSGTSVSRSEKRKASRKWIWTRAAQKVTNEIKSQ